MNWAIPLASLIAVVGGAGSYWQQKKWDRREAVRAERRAKYAEYVQARYDRLTAFFSSDEKTFRAQDTVYVATRDEIRIIAPSEVVQALDNHATKFNELWKYKSDILLRRKALEVDFEKLSSEERDAFDVVLNAMRADIRPWDKHALQHLESLDFEQPEILGAPHDDGDKTDKNGQKK
jgi:hypothetical protein